MNRNISDINNINDINEYYDWLHGYGSDPKQIFFNTFLNSRLKKTIQSCYKQILFNFGLVRKAWFHSIKNKKLVLGYSPLDFATDIFINELQYKWLYEKFVDDKSRRTMLNVLKYKATFDRDHLIESTGFLIDQYFDPEIVTVRPDEVFVDCGGYVGDTAANYCRLFKSSKKYYFFEPDAKNLDRAKKCLADILPIKFCLAATGDLDRKIGFCSKGAGGNIVNNSDMACQVEMVRLDSVVSEKITFVKMDIEGSEIPTLEGARRQIAANKPKLAICAYHKPDDLWRIARAILEIRPDYNLHLRLYESSYCETVIYAL